MIMAIIILISFSIVSSLSAAQQIQIHHTVVRSHWVAEDTPKTWRKLEDGNLGGEATESYAGARGSKDCSTV